MECSCNTSSSIYSWLSLIIYFLRDNNVFENYIKLHKNYLFDLLQKKKIIDNELRRNNINLLELIRLSRKCKSIKKDCYYVQKAIDKIIGIILETKTF